MATGFGSLEIARSGMFVSERGLYVTGHNISNVNTAGYVRQQAIISDSSYQNYPNYQLGMGADIKQIRQIRNAFIDNIFRQESTALGYWEARSNTLSHVEAILGEPATEGLQSLTNEFWSSWQELSKEPESLTTRAMVRQRSENLAYYINHLGTQLDNLQTSIDTEIKVRINEINTITEEIGRLNIEILKYESSGDKANDYRDRRNLLSDKLSKLVDADITEMNDGQYSVTLGGYFLVSGSKANRLFPGERAPGDIFSYPKIMEGNIEITVPVKGGLLKGLLESRGEVAGYKGSFENGSPNTKADIAIVVDVSNSDSTYLDRLKSSISTYVSELDKHGIDYNLRLIRFDGSIAADSGNYGKSAGAFLAAVNELEITPPTSANDFGSVVDALSGISDFRTGANRISVVFTDESIGGAGAAATDTEIADYNAKLAAYGITATIITKNSAGWDRITLPNGGSLHDIDASDYSKLMAEVATGNALLINKKLSLVQESNNIIPETKQRLNALINIMLREVNYLHRSGVTLSSTLPKPGSDLFVRINLELPLEMGNIKLNPELVLLSNIAASSGGGSGDNSIALKIANLPYNTILHDRNGTLDLNEYYQSLILRIGNMGSEAERITQNQQLLVASADNSRQAISGVSMDEEMSNMMKYQFAYNASSRTINVIDDMLDTIINRLGIAGR